jgi:mitochondrial fission protein ELM1
MESMQETEQPSCLDGATLWVAVTDKIGHVNQCVALTDALGAAPARMARIRGFNLRHRAGTKLLRRLEGLAQSLALLRGLPAGPLVLVISGRSSEYAAKLLRWRLGERLFVISVGPPINFPEVVDMAIMNQASLPKWQRRRAKSGRAIALEEVPICGAMARRFERPSLPPACDGRRLAVFVGGENKHFALTGERFASAIAPIRDIARSGAAKVEIVLSRRTASRTEKIVRETFAGTPATVHGGEESDRYRALLGTADVFVVTPDSVTMLSEVCLTGKPVFALDLETLPGSDGEGERLVEAMVERDVVCRFDGEIETFSPRERLDEAARIALVVAARIHEWSGAGVGSGRAGRLKQASAHFKNTG